MVKEWIRDIREKTENMGRDEKIRYIADYYWGHIALCCLIVFIAFLLVYNFTLGRHTVSLECAIVNTQTDDERDEKLERQIADTLGLKEQEVQVDSAYQVEVQDQKKTEGGTDYSGYDKFFFELGNRELDIVVMPESLMQYCTELGEELNEIGSEGKTWVYLKDTAIGNDVTENKGDPMVVVFPKNSRHEANASQLCESLLENRG